MDTAETGHAHWTEDSSQYFIDVGAVLTPDRIEIADAIVDLIPAEKHDEFHAVELAVGSGWLSKAILDAFPRAHILGLDGSPTMLEESGTALHAFSDRVELRQFNLEDRSWLNDLGGNVRCFVSCLTIHHLDAAGKQQLYQDLFHRVESGGAVLIADLVAPSSEKERQYMANAWDRVVERQSLAMTGSEEIYRRFLADEWNWYRYPDPMDMPATIPAHLSWLSDAGFIDCGVFWERAGHALYGGYK